jgi:hypothetical protein
LVSTRAFQRLRQDFPGLPNLPFGEQMVIGSVVIGYLEDLQVSQSDDQFDEIFGAALQEYRRDNGADEDLDWARIDGFITGGLRPLIACVRHLASREEAFYYFYELIVI